MTTTLPTLSIRQPWAFFVAQGLKPVENRDWKSWNPGLKFRGRFFIHAGKLMTRDDFGGCQDTIAKIPSVLEFLDKRGGMTVRELDTMCGGIVGVAEIVDVVTGMDDPWFFGPYGLVITNAKPLPFHPCKGQLGFFNATYPGTV